MGGVLNERNADEKGKKYVHKRLRSAYRNQTTNPPYLLS